MRLLMWTSLFLERPVWPSGATLPCGAAQTVTCNSLRYMYLPRLRRCRAAGGVPRAQSRDLQAPAEPKSGIGTQRVPVGGRRFDGNSGGIDEYGADPARLALDDDPPEQTVDTSPRIGRGNDDQDVPGPSAGSEEVARSATNCARRPGGQCGLARPPLAISIRLVWLAATQGAPGRPSA